MTPPGLVQERENWELIQKLCRQLSTILYADPNVLILHRTLAESGWVYQFGSKDYQDPRRYTWIETHLRLCSSIQMHENITRGRVKPAEQLQQLYDLGSLLAHTAIWDVDPVDFGEAVMQHAQSLATRFDVTLKPSPEEEEETHA